MAGVRYGSPVAGTVSENRDAQILLAGSLGGTGSDAGHADRTRPAADRAVLSHAPRPLRYSSRHSHTLGIATLNPDFS